MPCGLDLLDEVKANVACGNMLEALRKADEFTKTTKEELKCKGTRYVYRTIRGDVCVSISKYKSEADFRDCCKMLGIEKCQAVDDDPELIATLVRRFKEERCKTK